MSQNSSQQPQNIRENSHKRILLYCPEKEPREQIITFLKKRGFHNHYVQNNERDLLPWIDQYGIDVVLLFEPSNVYFSVDFAQWLRKRHPDCPVAILPSLNGLLLEPNWKRNVLETVYGQGGVQ